jgi:hypothetical protein
MADPLRSGALFRARADVLKSPIPRVLTHGQHHTDSVGAAGSNPISSSAYMNSLNRPVAQKIPQGSVRTFEELYQTSPMPKVIAAQGRVGRPAPRAVPAVPTWHENDARDDLHRARQLPSVESRKIGPRSIALLKWSVRPCMVDDKIEVTVTGFPEDAERGQAVVVSSPIAVIVASHKVMTSAGTLYNLQGDMDSAACTPAMHATIREGFKYGFPKGWKDIIKQCHAPEVGSSKLSICGPTAVGVH